MSSGLFSVVVNEDEEKSVKERERVCCSCAAFECDLLFLFFAFLRMTNIASLPCVAHSHPSLVFSCFDSTPSLEFFFTLSLFELFLRLLKSSLQLLLKDFLCLWDKHQTERTSRGRGGSTSSSSCVLFSCVTGICSFVLLFSHRKHRENPCHWNSIRLSLASNLQRKSWLIWIFVETPKSSFLDNFLRVLIHHLKQFHHSFTLFLSQYHKQHSSQLTLSVVVCTDSSPRTSSSCVIENKSVSIRSGICVLLSSYFLLYYFIWNLIRQFYVDAHLYDSLCSRCRCLWKQDIFTAQT